MADSSKNKIERLQPSLAKPVYTDGGKLHYFCEGRGGGVEEGGLAEFTEVVYKLKEGWSERTLGQNIYRMFPIIRLTARHLFNSSKDFMFHHCKTSPETLYINFGKKNYFRFLINHLKHKQISVG